MDFFDKKGCRKLGIVCERGDLVLWDSRTFHMGTEPRRERTTPNIRLCAYVCCVPISLLKSGKERDRIIDKKIAHFRNARTTNHWPHRPHVFGLLPQTYGAELPDYKMVEPFGEENLTDLGRSLVGFPPLLHSSASSASRQPAQPPLQDTVIVIDDSGDGSDDVALASSSRVAKSEVEHEVIYIGSDSDDDYQEGCLADKEFSNKKPRLV